MRAMILAAGRGMRMGKLTDNTPKPLLRARGNYLIEYIIRALSRAKINEIVINVSYHAQQIKTALGDGSRYGVSIFYSEEKECLETGGGILKALPQLGPQPFLVVSSDIITDYPFEHLTSEPLGLAHLVMVTNPSYHPQGDFGLSNGRIALNVNPMLTFASMGVYRKELFADCMPGHFRLTQLLFPAIAESQLTGEHYQGLWYNVGTPEDLADVAAQNINAFSN